METTLPPSWNSYDFERNRDGLESEMTHSMDHDRGKSIDGRRIHVEHGPPVNPTFNEEEIAEQPADVGASLWWSKVRHNNREAFSEFFGTFILVVFGNGSIAQVVLSKDTHGDWSAICWGWGIGIMLGVYCSGISGAHLNPAITFANCVYRKFPWRKFPIYMISQILGAMCAALVVYGNYKSAIDVFEGGVGIRTVPGYSENGTANIFCSYPQEFMTTTGQFFSEFIIATLIMFVIYVIKDDKNLGAGPFAPLALFFLVFGIGACFGWETGFATSLARDFGPRLASYMVGYGNEVWTYGHHYFLIPPIASFTGCLFGGWLYDTFLFTGESPINTPWMGVRRVVHPQQEKKRESMQYA